MASSRNHSFSFHPGSPVDQDKCLFAMFPIYFTDVITLLLNEINLGKTLFLAFASSLTVDQSLGSVLYFHFMVRLLSLFLFFSLIVSLVL